MSIYETVLLVFMIAIRIMDGQYFLNWKGNIDRLLT